MLLSVTVQYTLASCDISLQLLSSLKLLILALYFSSFLRSLNGSMNFMHLSRWALIGLICNTPLCDIAGIDDFNQILSTFFITFFAIYLTVGSFAVIVWL